MRMYVYWMYVYWWKTLKGARGRCLRGWGLTSHLSRFHSALGLFSVLWGCLLLCSFRVGVSGRGFDSGFGAQCVGYGKWCTASPSEVEPTTAVPENVVGETVVSWCSCSGIELSARRWRLMSSLVGGVFKGVHRHVGYELHGRCALASQCA